MTLAQLFERLEQIRKGVDGDRFTMENIDELVRDLHNQGIDA